MASCCVKWLWELSDYIVAHELHRRAWMRMKETVTIWNSVNGIVSASAFSSSASWHCVGRAFANMKKTKQQPHLHQMEAPDRVLDHHVWQEEMMQDECVCRHIHKSNTQNVLSTSAFLGAMQKHGKPTWRNLSIPKIQYKKKDKAKYVIISYYTLSIIFSKHFTLVRFVGDPEMTTRQEYTLNKVFRFFPSHLFFRSFETLNNHGVLKHHSVENIKIFPLQSHAVVLRQQQFLRGKKKKNTFRGISH